MMASEICQESRCQTGSGPIDVTDSRREQRTATFHLPNDHSVNGFKRTTNDFMYYAEDNEMYDDESKRLISWFLRWFSIASGDLQFRGTMLETASERTLYIRQLRRNREKDLCVAQLA